MAARICTPAATSQNPKRRECGSRRRRSVPNAQSGAGQLELPHLRSWSGVRADNGQGCSRGLQTNFGDSRAIDRCRRPPWADSASCSRQQSSMPTGQEPGDDYPFKLRRQGDGRLSWAVRRTVQPRVRHASRTTGAQATGPTRNPANKPTSQHANNPADRSASVTKEPTSHFAVTKKKAASQCA